MATNARGNLAELRAAWVAATPEARPVIALQAANVETAVARAQACADVDEQVENQRKRDTLAGHVRRAAEWSPDRIRAVMAGRETE